MTEKNTLPALYVLTDEYLQAYRTLAELDVPDQVVTDTLEGLRFPLEQKGTAVAQMARNMEELAASIKRAEGEMAARRKAIEARADRLRAYLKENMERAGIQKIESPYFKISIRKNPPALVIPPGAQIPDRYMRIPPVPEAEPDRKLIKETLEAGGAVEGCYIQQATRIEIK